MSTDEFKFRYFKGGKRFKGYFVKAETENKTLAFVTYQLAAGTTTGFKSAIDHVSLAVFDREGNLLEALDLREGNSGKDIKQRGEAVELLKKEFADCPQLIADLYSFLKAKDDPTNMRIAYYFQSNDNYIRCE